MQDSASIPSPSAPPIPFSSTSSLTLCPELDLSVTASPPKPPSHKQTRGKRNAKVSFHECVVAKVTPEPQMPPDGDALPPPATTKQRIGRGCLSRGAPNQGVDPPVEASNEHPDSLEDVQLNTTLAVKAELLALQGAEFNSQKAVKETLEKMEHTKKQINSKAAQGINVSRSQTLFTSLVSVDVPESELMSQVFKDRLPLAPPLRSHDAKSTDGPCHLIFLTSDLFRQKPLPPEEEPFDSTAGPVPRAASSTFDLYRRQRRWEASP
uniref:protein phosphatase 1 regulatory subunit 35 isoform X2 n=1 Tax=Doryrhamphus excisus TaxID=161450 RepID=UPI0025ADF61E|nr:protein phosphatase 1 regulatory subunit 35 isoform X2 [Doryrhamphus excisus]